MADTMRFMFGLRTGWRLWLVGALWALTAGRAAAEPWQRDPVLSQVLIRHLLTDPTGYQWIATDDGVFRSDGYELIPLARLTCPGSAAAPKGLVSTLCLDPAGYLWIGSDIGLFRLTLLTGALRRVAVSQEAGASPTTIVQLFRHPRAGHLWVSCGDGSTVVLAAGSAGARSGQLLSRRFLPGMGFRFQPDGTAAGVWVSFVEMGYFDPRQQRERLGLPGLAQVGPTGPVQRYVPTNSVMVPVPGTAPLRAFSANALYELTADNQFREIRRWLTADFSDNFLPTPLPTDTAYEWISQHHYVRLTVRGPRAGAVAIDSMRLGEAPDPYRHCFVVHRDDLGGQWVYSRAWRGTYKRRTAAGQPILRLRQANGRVVPSMRGITRLPDGRLLLGSYNGPFVQAADSPRAPVRRLAHIHTERTRLDKRPGEQGTILQFPTLYDVLTTRATPPTTVVAEEDIGFSVLDLAMSRCRRLPMADAERHRPTRFLTLLEFPQGQVWGGTDSGLFVIDLRRQQVRRYQPVGRPAARLLRRLSILDLAPDSATGSLWLATAQGLYRLQPATGALSRVGAPYAAHPLPTDELLCVAASGPSRAWVGTRNAGLLLADAQYGLLRHLTLADGLPSATVATVLVRPDATVWAGTYAGLIRYDPAQQRLAVFGPAAGLAEAEMNRNSAYSDLRTGALFFGGVGGTFQVAPTTKGQAESDRRRPIRLLATAWAEANGRGRNEPPPVPHPLRAGAPAPALHLGAQPGDFVEIRLALTELLTPDFTHYAYRLRRAHEDSFALPAWQPTTRRLVLQGLAAGTYTVEIRAETSTGQPAGNLVRVPLHVARVWWQHPLTWALAALALVGLTYGGFWLQNRRSRREARLRDELAANLHDEVGGLLTKISLMAEVLHHTHEDGTDEKAEKVAMAGDKSPGLRPASTAPLAPQLAGRLLLNSRAAVQALRDVVWSVDSRADSAQALLDRIADHLDQVAPVAGWCHTFEADPLPRLYALRPLVLKQLYFIFKEAITNAVRHAKGATTVHVRLAREGNYYVLEITDNGQAAASTGRSGLGLRSMSARARAINGTLSTGPRPNGAPGYRVQVKGRM